MIKVLLIDDEAAALEEMQEILVRSGLECQVAEDGWRALELVGRGFQPDVVVTDIRMPELGGIELAAQLRALMSGKQPAIVFVSGHADFDEAGDNIVREPDGRWRVKAQTEIVDFDSAFGSTLAADEFDTVGGLLIQRFGRLPTRGESILIHGLRFHVLRADSRRLHLLQVERVQGGADGEALSGDPVSLADPSPKTKDRASTSPGEHA